MITISDNAVLRLREKLAEKAGDMEPKEGLRLLVEKGGCAGMQYGMKFDDREESDAVFEREGVRSRESRLPRRCGTGL
jgi:iron-sulfur cluster assembly protein